jgi:threonine dehydratase
MTSLLPGILPTLDDVRAAAHAMRGIIPETRLAYSTPLSDLLGTPVWFKMECEQLTGSFKVRGAFTVLHRMSAADRARGVVASSAGNHGLGVAWAAHHFRAPATLYVPRHAPQVKKDGIAALGTIVNDTADDYDHAMVLAKAHAAREGIPFINPCLGVDLLAGQGTAALEILEQGRALQANGDPRWTTGGSHTDGAAPGTVVVCVGGGGLLGGTGAVLRALAPQVHILGAQGVRTAAMTKSLAAGHVVEIASERTLADGLAGQIDDAALAIGQRCLDDIVALEEEAIGRAIAWLHQHHGITIEGAGAVTVAALLERAARGAPPPPGPIVAMVSGRNIDASRHAEVLAGLTR